jgi:hypothetical protein
MTSTVNFYHWQALNKSVLASVEYQNHNMIKRKTLTLVGFIENDFDFISLIFSQNFRTLKASQNFLFKIVNRVSTNYYLR